MERAWTDEEGRSWRVALEGDLLVFEGSGRRYGVRSARADDLEALDDRVLRELFEEARSAGPLEASSPSSPSAVGRESSPHTDPARSPADEPE